MFIVYWFGQHFLLIFRCDAEDFLTTFLTFIGIRNRTAATTAWWSSIGRTFVLLFFQGISL